jgi:hypothetical protein
MGHSHNTLAMSTVTNICIGFLLCPHKCVLLTQLLSMGLMYAQQTRMDRPSPPTKQRHQKRR